MSHQIPEIYCDLSLLFPVECDDGILQHIIAISAGASIYKKNSESSVKCLIVAKTGYLKTWYLDEALAQLFRKIEGILPELADLTQVHGAKALVNIAFWQYGTYPALSITGKNMAHIRALWADIDIDPYDGYEPVFPDNPRRKNA